MTQEDKDAMRDYIEDSIIVDANDEDEIQAAWATYLEDNLQFPFWAKAPLKRRGGAIEVVPVEVIGVSDKNYENEGKWVEVIEKGKNTVVEIGVEKLVVPADHDAVTAIETWKFWLSEEM